MFLRRSWPLAALSLALLLFGFASALWFGPSGTGHAGIIHPNAVAHSVDQGSVVDLTRGGSNHGPGVPIGFEQYSGSDRITRQSPDAPWMRWWDALFGQSAGDGPTDTGLEPSSESSGNGNPEEPTPYFPDYPFGDGDDYENSTEDSVEQWNSEQPLYLEKQCTCPMRWP
jgi:hypothetical protein